MSERRGKRTEKIFMILMSVLLMCAPLTAVFAEPVQNEPGGKGLSFDTVFNEDLVTSILYDNTNGLPTSEANDIVQTKEGFIWIGSYSGLVRYDGRTFERLETSPAITSVNCLYVDGKDRLWIGTNDSGIAMLEKGNLTFWGEADGLRASSVRGIAEDENGVIYVATTGGNNKIDKDLKLQPFNDPRVYNTFMESLDMGPGNVIYARTMEGDVFTIHNGIVDGYYDCGKSDLGRVTSISPDEEHVGKVFFETEGENLYYGSFNNGFQDVKEIDIGDLSQVQEVRRINGILWLCTRSGIALIDDDGFKVLKSVPMKYSVSHVIQDYEDNLWFTSTRQGVMKIVSNKFFNLFRRLGIENTVVNSTCMLGKRLFIGTDSGLIVTEDEKVIKDIPLTSAATLSGAVLDETNLIEMLDGVRIRSIICDSKNRLWISTSRVYGLIRYENGKAVVYTEDDGMSSDKIRTVYERKDGTFLTAGTGGVCLIDDNSVRTIYAGKHDIINTEILTVTESPNGDIVAGSDGGGIYIISDTGTKHIGSAEGLKSPAVMRIKYDEKRNIYWVVTGNSIAWMDADYNLTTLKNFPYSNNFDLYENSRGEMWILSSDGIYVAKTEDLLKDKEIATIHYGISEGLPCITTANSYSELTEKGELYIAGNTSVTRVDIENSGQSVMGLKASIPFIEADGVRMYPDEKGVFTVSDAVRKVTIFPYVFNYSLGDPQISYMLEGFDDEPETIKRSALVPQDYTNLPGGTYRFTMELKDPISDSMKMIAVTIKKTKAFYEYVGFYAGIAAVVAACIWLAVKHYVRFRISKLEKKHREEAEKERIATELNMANQIQTGMMTKNFFPERPEFDVYASMNPAREVGGDFYDVFLIDDDHLGLVIADVSGKGIPAALYMMVSKVIVQSVAMLGRSSGEILTKTNEALCSGNSAEMFVTAWVGILEISTGKLTAANAGHEYPAIMKAGGKYELLRDKHGLVIGAMDGIVYKEYELQFEPGDKLFVYSDGVPEANDASNNLFTTERMLKALNSDVSAGPEQVLKNVHKAVDDFVKDAEQFDDLTMLCMEYNGKA